MPAIGGIGGLLSAWRRLGLVAALGFFVATHLGAIFTEGVNMDEVALLDRARETLASGRLETGGRPGLATLVLTPFVHGCTDAIATARSARVAWAALTFALLAGLYALVGGFHPPGTAPGKGPAVAVATLALAPPFLRWSIQVRSDQLALACALWGGVAILASRRRRAWAWLGGAMLALGYLASQKALYAAALVGVLAVGREALARPSPAAAPGRWLLDLARRAGPALAAAVAVVGLYRTLVGWFLELPPSLRLGKGLEVFAWYREVLGFSPYWAMLPGLWPQIVLASLLVAATARGVARKRQRGPLLLAWAVLGLGAAVGAFHAGTFPYFWMTLGLFPAVALGLAWEAVQELLGGRRSLAIGAAVLLVAANVAPALGLLEDTQTLQRQTLSFVDRHLPPTAPGYSPEGVLFCRSTPEPLRRLFTHDLDVRFGGQQGHEYIARLIDEFRSKGIVFLIASTRLERFPEPFRDFLRRHYVFYRHAAMVHGLRFQATPGVEREFEVLVPGPYRLWSLVPRQELVTEVGGQSLATGTAVELLPGRHRLRVVRGQGPAVLAYAAGAPPLPGREWFFSREQIVEARGFR